MLLKGKLLLSAAAILTHAAAAAIEEIPESKEVSSADAAGGERELYGPESRYNGARTYDEAQKYTSARVRTVYKDSNGAEYIFRYKSGQRHKVWISGHDDTDTKPTSKPSSYTATYTTDEHTGTYKGKVYTDEAGNYVYRFRDGVRNKVYVNEPGWDGGGRGYRERTGEKTRPKNDSWSPPTPTWSPTKWKPGIPYAGNYNFNYKQPSSPEPTMVPTWEHDGHGRAYGNCVEPFKSSCCSQKDYYSFGQKQALCKKLGCDYQECSGTWGGDVWKSGSKPTMVPTWDTVVDDDWSGGAVEQCLGASRKACCSQTKGDEATKQAMCLRLKCDWSKCQKDASWGGDTHKPTTRPPTPPPSGEGWSHPSTSKPTWSADGWTGDANDDWTGDGKCSTEEQDRCCSQHDSKSLEEKAKTCTNKFGCEWLKCDFALKVGGSDGWYSDTYEDFDWNDDGHDDDKCTAQEQVKCCSQHDGLSLYRQFYICKELWNCALLKCPKHRQSGWAGDVAYDQDNNEEYGYGDDQSKKDKKEDNKCDQNCCSPSKRFNSFKDWVKSCEDENCNWQNCKSPNYAYKYNDSYEKPTNTCTDKLQKECCQQEDSLKAAVKNCEDNGCDIARCNTPSNTTAYESGPNDNGSKQGFGYKGSKTEDSSGSVNMYTTEKSSSGNFLEPSVTESCKKTYSGNTCTETCTTTSEYKIGPIVMDVKKEVSTRSCST